jgi:hypothetical protein
VCTASWLITPEGFELFFNRDESLRRGRALPPAELELGATRALAPTDPDGGGTWIGVNRHGLALALLNARDGLQAEAPERRSRGLLVRDLLALARLDELPAALARQELGRTRAFTLLALAPGAPPRAFAWDGEALAERAPLSPLCSSSLDATRASAERRRLFERLSRAHEGRALCERFQASHEPERGPWSPCMHRADAATVSASQVRVGRAEVALRYADGAPCRASFGAWLVRPRA